MKLLGFNRICKRCSKQYIARCFNGCYCSVECGRLHQGYNIKPLSERKFICKWCKRKFIPHSGTQSYCNNCLDKYAKDIRQNVWRTWFRAKTGCGPKVKKCVICGEDFIAKTKAEKYCSKVECWKEYLRNRAKKGYHNNHIEILKRIKRKFKTNPELYLKHKIRIVVRGQLKKNKADKFGRTFEMVGCSPNKLKKHLENKFKYGMSWDNYGHDGWVVDHIRPCCSFDLTKEAEQRKCFNYRNLQPLWEVDNLHKSGKYAKI